MFDTLADVPPLLVALSLVSTTLLGVALAAKPTTQPRAAPLASTVDTVASADHASSETRAIDADTIRLTRHAIEVRDGGDTSRETYAYGPVAPVRRDTVLWRVLHGTLPDDVFDDERAFERAVADARDRDAAWRRDRQQLTVRRVTWRGVDVTLAGA
ncbi:DUF7283 family protein [Halobacterium noricense]|uniref:DUF7283 family protein n=1 Tax=Halobacterium noricense TaxID=223182 RepID=UPI001E4058EF|nr:hypothetical protein [Halobacterium noricense]UHH25745.1 hypothetical protein LT974_02145 [Halobacterium noricense]